jgi:hypothetical protein
MLRRVDKKNKKMYMQTINVFRTNYSRKEKKSVDRKINTNIYRRSEKKSRRH